tara:strand:+ start:2926 stop:3297 length:372 start_codon:yes stop_codon:yes gene_type:complete
MAKEKVVRLEDKKASQVPAPCGFKLLIAIPEKEKKTEGGVLLPEDTRRREEAASLIGMVMKVGPDAYKDENRFPTGPWCKEGDFIVMRSYSGTRMVIHGQEFRLINDDSVEAVVDDPRGVSKA